MKNEKNIQVEDSPSVDTSSPKSETQPVVETSAKPGFFKRILPWCIVAVVFFIGGMCLIYFTMVTKLNASLKTSTDQAAQLTEQLSASDLDLQKAQTELSTANTSLADANNSLTSSEILKILYKFQADVNLARYSLLNLDPSTAKQALNLANEDLKDLSATTISPDSIAGLQPQIDSALSNVESDPAKSANALATLYTNLLLISDNLK